MHMHMHMNMRLRTCTYAAGERAGIETAEQAVRAVMLAQSRGAGQLP